MSKTYKITKKNKNINQATILKSGLEANVTIAELAQDVRQWTKTKVEMMANKGIFTAMIMNIEKHYPIVLKLNPEQLAAVTVYARKREELSIAKDNLKSLDKNYENYFSEFQDIKKALGITQETDLDLALAEYKATKDTNGLTIKKALEHAKKNKKRA